jgi:hypothetical protein
MAYKLAIDDQIGVNIKGKVISRDGKEKDFKFVLVCDRLSQTDLAAISTDGKTTIEFFMDRARDWQGQTLVLDQDDKPAAFSAEALSALMSMSGMGNLCWHAYLQQVQATAKN